MSDQKTKVKDLSQELGLPTKEVLTLLRELGIPAKSTMSAVPNEELDRVRDAAKTGVKREVMRKETASGVIVRRRKKQAKAESSEAAPAREKAAEGKPAAKPAEPVAEAPAQEAEAKAAKPAKADKPKTDAKPAEAGEAAPAKARIVKPEETEKPKVRVVSPDELKAKAKEEEAVEPPQPAAESTAAAEAKQVEDAAPAKAEKPAKEEQPAKPAKAEEAEAAQKPAKADADAADSSDADDDDADRKKKKKKKKPKRREEVVTPQVRVISRPDPAQVEAERAREEQERQERQERQSRGPRGGAPRGPGRDDNRGGRDDSRGGPGRPRPAGGGPRPAGGAPRGAGPRPSGPGGAGGPGMAPPPPMPDDNAASRKRKGKGKRTVEFGQDRFDEGEKRVKRGGKGKGGQQDDWSRGKRGKKGKRPEPQVSQPLKAAKRKIKVDEAIRVSDMAHQMGIKAPEIIKILMQLGIMATINQSLDLETAGVVASEFGYEVEKTGFSEDDYLIPTEPDKPEELKIRPPVVTIMGHVDHGKTSLLDAIRKSTVTEGEAGGITQHIGAYHVSTPNGDLCFLDTPGHEAFTAMRMRGAQVTDIVILVVAADDGVMEQTREAVSHSKAAGVPIVVAVNKIDKEGANPERVMRELSELGLVPEDWGGDTIFTPVSAKTREGLDELLDLLALQAEVLELKANPDKPARGHIVEAKLDKGRGPVGTVLIQEGTLRQGDAFVCGVYSGRVRAMFNDQGKKVKEAGPSHPVEVQGFDGVPEAGEEFVAISDEKVARRIADQRTIKERERTLARESKVTLETFLSRRADEAEAMVLNVVLKADVQGSVEAIADALRKQSTEKVRVEIIHSGAGAITESDILLASASDAIIIGFNVRPTVKVKDVAEQEGVDIRFYDIIYKLVDEIKAAMSGLLAPVIKEQYLGQAEVLQTFSVPKIGIIAGCRVEDGKIVRNGKARLLRDGVVVYTGHISSLKRLKDDAKEVAKGYECGIGLENFNDIKEHDVIEAFEEVEEAATL